MKLSDLMGILGRTALFNLLYGWLVGTLLVVSMFTLAGVFWMLQDLANGVSVTESIENGLQIMGFMLLVAVYFVPAIILFGLIGLLVSPINAILIILVKRFFPAFTWKQKRHRIFSLGLIMVVVFFPIFGVFYFIFDREQRFYTYVFFSILIALAVVLASRRVLRWHETQHDLADVESAAG